MMSKVLPITTQNIITSRLHNALLLAAILTYPNLVPWYYEHFIQVYSLTQRNNFHDFMKNGEKSYV